MCNDIALHSQYWDGCGHPDKHDSGQYELGPVGPVGIGVPHPMKHGFNIKGWFLDVYIFLKSCLG